MKDYTVEKEILEKLNALKIAKEEINNFSPIQKGASKMINSYYQQESVPENLEEVLKTLQDAGLQPKEIFNICTVLLEEVQPYVKESNKILKEMKDGEDNIKNDIGKLIMKDMPEEMTERNCHFEYFGDVKCSRESVPSIQDENKVKQALAKDTSLLPFLSISKKVLKYKDVESIPGIEMNDEYVVTVRSSLKD